MVRHTSLGIPPLAGLAGYEDAARPGLSVERSVALLKRFAYVERRLMEIAIAHLCATPEWEVKCAFSLHCWLDAEHATALRQRVAEMREPPLHLDEAPDARLATALDEALCSRGTVELLTALYRVVKPALVAAYRRYLAETNPLADHPTCRQVRLIVAEEEDTIAWGEAALVALMSEGVRDAAPPAWAAHLTAYLEAAGGVWGDANGADPLPPPRSQEPFVADVVPQRDRRFSRLYNSNGSVDAVPSDPERAPDERTLALMWRRLREMDVPEMIAGIVVRTPDQPWEYYRDMARQLWDEARHAMMGETAFEGLGIDWTALPVPVDFSYIYNTQMTPLESHAKLYSIEQRLMNRQTGKRAEWEVALHGNNPLATTFQDYDWADEVLHAQIGRRWLVPQFGDRERVAAFVESVSAREGAAYTSDPRLTEADASDWWPAFYLRMQETQKAAPRHAERAEE